MNNVLQDFLAQLNADIFYREFSFSRNDFVPVPGEQKEFADHVVWIDNLLIIYQLKQRGGSKDISEETERRWFKNKILGKATKQVRDTLHFLKEHPEITIQNQRGHVFNVNSESLKHIIKLIVYAPSRNLPESCLRIRHHVSSTAGFIHIVPWPDYVGVCLTLLTPAEFVEYFQFREAIIDRWSEKGQIPSEPALVGQFLWGDDNARPSEEYVEFLNTLKQDHGDFDISYLLAGIGERITYSKGMGAETDYYAILAEFAKLHRGDLKEVKKRVVMCLEAVRDNQFMRPTRIIAPTTGCGFVFIPVEEELVEQRINGLGNLTYAAKYEHRLQRQVGVCFAKEGEYIHIDWCFQDFPWQHDADVEAMLRDSNPFLPLRSEIRPRYEFEQ